MIAECTSWSKSIVIFNITKFKCQFILPSTRTIEIITFQGKAELGIRHDCDSNGKTLKLTKINANGPPGLRGTQKRTNLDKADLSWAQSIHNRRAFSNKWL